MEQTSEEIPAKIVAMGLHESRSVLQHARLQDPHCHCFVFRHAVGGGAFRSGYIVYQSRSHLGERPRELDYSSGRGSPDGVLYFPMLVSGPCRDVDGLQIADNSNGCA